MQKPLRILQTAPKHYLLCIIFTKKQLKVIYLMSGEIQGVPITLEFIQVMVIHYLLHSLAK